MTRSTRYAEGAASGYCTGDNRFGGTGEVTTEFTVRSPGPNPWDPLSYPEMTVTVHHRGSPGTTAT